MLFDLSAAFDNINYKLISYSSVILTWNSRYRCKLLEVPIRLFSLSLVCVYRFWDIQQQN